MIDLSNKFALTLEKMSWSAYMSLFSAWMKGAQIQYWSTEFDGWFDCNPGWVKTLAYRVKPDEPVSNDLNHTPQSIGRSQAVYCH